MWCSASSDNKKGGKHTTSLISDVTNLNSKFCDLVKSGDGKKLANELYDSKAVLLAPDCPLKNGVNEIGEHYNKAFKEMGVVACQSHVREVGYMSDLTDRIFAISCYSMFDKAGGIVETGRCVIVLEKVGSKWKIVVDAYTPIHDTSAVPPQMTKNPIIQKTWTSINAEKSSKGPIKSIKQWLQKWCQQYNDGEVEDLVKSMYTHDAAVFPPKEFPKMGQTDVIGHLKSLKDSGITNISNTLVQCVGDQNDQFAFVTGLSKFEDNQGNQRQVGKFLLLLRKDLECSGDWLQYLSVYSCNEKMD